MQSILFLLAQSTPDLIQIITQDYGVKANLKTDALIDLLLDASQ